MNLADVIQYFSFTARQKVPLEIDFETITWMDPKLCASGIYTGIGIKIDVDLSRPEVQTRCSWCGKSRFCAHVLTLMSLMDDMGIADEIEAGGFAPCKFELKKNKRKLISRWKSQFAELAQHCSWPLTGRFPPAAFPTGREAIYVINLDRYGQNDMLEIHVATRPAPHAANTGQPTRQKKPSKSKYKPFKNGVRGLAASTDPLDRDVADRLTLSKSEFFESESTTQVKLFLPPDKAPDLLARLAMSGRMYFNEESALHNGIQPLSWFGSEPFELKFEISGTEQGDLALGFCMGNSIATIAGKDVAQLWRWCFLDSQNRLGVLRRPVSLEIKSHFERAEPIRVPRKEAGELISKVMSLPIGLPLHFNDCPDIAPQRLSVSPRPMIHIKAPKWDMDDRLNAEIFFDYDGWRVSSQSQMMEMYDKNRSVIVPIDQDFHSRCLQQLVSIGVKPQHTYNGAPYYLSKKKLPGIVGQLIRHGWHVEADGKLYRNGKRCELSIVSGIDWFELQGKADFEHASVDLPRLLQSLRRGENTIVLDDGSIGLIPEDWIRKFGAVAELADTKDGAIKFAMAQVGLLDALLAQQGDVNIDEKFSAARQSLREFDQIKPADAPKEFCGVLRPYQQLAQGWFEFLRKLGFGGCLADDMGLGKTVQVLAMLEQRREEKRGPSLIVVPRSLVFNWASEARKFTPRLRVLDQSHSQRIRGTQHLSDYDLVLTTYGTLRRDAAILKDFLFDYVILDEAQAIKNASTDAAKAARILQGRHKLALSGTPIENHLGELWSLFDFLNPGMLGRVGRFADLADGSDIQERKLLATAVRPFILRRTKKQVAPELPDRVEQTILVELDATQRKAYDELRDFYRQSLLQKIEADGIGKSQIVILEALLRLRQAACHPGLIDKSATDKPSAKLDELMTRLASAVESNERVLVFSQFTSFLAIVKSRLDEAKIGYLYLDGQTRDRQALVEQFQSGAGPGVFLISLKAGGVGLNLTAARTVYLLDPWWNPAVEAQAIDRTHRIGQQQTVFASRLIAADTVEQKVLDLQAKKRGLADAIINADNGGISSLTREDLELLLA